MLSRGQPDFANYPHPVICNLDFRRHGTGVSHVHCCLAGARLRVQIREEASRQDICYGGDRAGPNNCQKKSAKLPKWDSQALFP